MSGEITITANKTFDEVSGEKVDLSKLNQLGKPSARVNAGSITQRELAKGSVTSDNLDSNIVSQINASAQIGDSAITTSKIADDAIIKAKLAADVLELIYPVNSIWMTMDESNAAPANRGLPGSWQRVAQGRALFGYNPGDQEFDATGNSDTEPTNVWSGSHSVTLAKANLPAVGVGVNVSGSTSYEPHHKHHGITARGAGVVEVIRSASTGGNQDHPLVAHPVNMHDYWNDVATKEGGGHSHSFSGTGSTNNLGSGQSFDNRSPGTIVAVWQRVS